MRARQLAWHGASQVLRHGQALAKEITKEEKKWWRRWRERNGEKKDEEEREMSGLGLSAE